MIFSNVLFLLVFAQFNNFHATTENCRSEALYQKFVIIIYQEMDTVLNTISHEVGTVLTSDDLLV